MRIPVLIAALAALGCGGGGGAKSGPEPEKEPVLPPPIPLVTTPFAGQSIAVTPLTLIVAADTIGGIAPLNDRTLALAWADSIIGEAINSRGPDVKWVLPAELRKVARRAPTVAPDPDKMGQAALREPELEEVPDPFRSYIRNLVALINGRYALVPAALSFTPRPDGRIRAELALAIADTRSNKVPWQTVAWADGKTPALALSAAMATVLPLGF
jgi:hypothetical protein